MSAVVPEVLRQARDNASVLKVGLAKIRERSGCLMVIVLEGRDDLPVYENWISRLSLALEWEPLVANGKKKALEFRALLMGDQTGIGACTYFIVDHDYDGTRGFPTGDDLFILPAHSIENYLVHESVMDSLLRTDFGLAGLREDRQGIIKKYIKSRKDFVEAVRGACERLFGALNEPVGNVRIGDVKSCLCTEDGQIVVQDNGWIARLVTTDQPVSAGGEAKGREFLSSQDDYLWIRGKFLFYFFFQFCELLHADARSVAPIHFSSTISGARPVLASLDFSNLAARSPIPPGLREILLSWDENCRLRYVA